MLVRLGTVLEESLDQLGHRRRLQELRAVLLWPEAVGPAVSRHTVAEGVERGVLLVRADSPAWAQQLAFLKPALKGRLNQELGEEVIVDIRLRSGSLRRGKVNPRPPRGEPEPPGLSPEEWGYIDGEASRVTDQDLRAILKRVLVAARTIHKWKKGQGWSPCPGCGALSPRRGRLCPVCALAPPQRLLNGGKG